MAFETGTVTNSHQLIQKLYTFLKSIGWQDVAALRGNVNSDGYDFVLKSTGKYDDRDIYIRIAAGLYDTNTNGDVQLPLDGYTEHINGFAYQYFPSDGTKGSDGRNELGIYGPILYYQQSDSSSEGATAYWDVDEHNLWRYSGDSTGQGLGTIPPRRKVYDWTQSGWGYYAERPGFFDGKNTIYASMNPGSGPYYWKVNIHDNTMSYVSVSLPTNNNYMCHQCSAYVRTAARNEYAYFMRAGSGTNNKTLYLCRFNVATDSSEGLFSNDYPFNFQTDDNGKPKSGFMVVGTKRKRNGQYGPQHRLLYVGRGNYSNSQSDGNGHYLSDGAGTYDWTYVNGENGRWHPTGITPQLPWEIGIEFWGVGVHWPYALYAMKEITGYAYDRLYLFRGSNSTNFASIAIDDDGYAMGSWSEHAATPQIQAYSQQQAFILGNKICWIPGLIWNDNHDNNLYTWQFPTSPTASGSWRYDSATFLNCKRSYTSSNIIFKVHEHLCNRAHITEFQTNTYWAFADQNHLVVVIKDAANKYNYIYTGLFETYADQRVTRTTSDLSAGATLIPVEDSSLFSVGNKYMILETGDAYQTITNYFGQSKKVAPSEMFTVIGISGNSLVVSGLTYAYDANSLVGADPLPLMVRVHGIEFAQTLNNINLSTPTTSFKDPVWQRYKLEPAVDDTFANATDIDERAQTVYLYGITLLDTGDTYSGKEVRGQLYDVYACGVALASGADVAVGSDTYVAFDIEQSGETLRIVVGPK